MELGPLVVAHTPPPLENRLPSRLPIEQALKSGHDVHRKAVPTPPSRACCCWHRSCCRPSCCCGFSYGLAASLSAWPAIWRVLGSWPMIGSLAADLMTPNENRLRCLSPVALGGPGGGPEAAILCEGLRLKLWADPPTIYKDGDSNWWLRSDAQVAGDTYWWPYLQRYHKSLLSIRYINK